MPVRYFYLLIFFCLLPLTNWGQIVYLGSPVFENDSAKFYTENSLNGEYDDNDGNYVLQIQISSSNHFRSEDKIKSMKLEGNFKWLRNGSENIQKRWLFFSQFNYHVAKNLLVSSIWQTQNNGNLDVAERSLTGLGLIWEVHKGTKFNVSLTNYAMIELEKAKHFQYEAFYRHSTRLGWGLNLFDNKLLLQNRTYFQPVYKNPKDFKVMNQFKLEIPITKHLRLFNLVEYYLDRYTPLDRSQYYVDAEFGFSINW